MASSCVPTSHHQPPPSMSSPHLIIVTGANRGIGKAICQQILKRPDLQSLKLFATSRSGDDLGLEGVQADRQAVYRRLDVTNRESILGLRREVESEGGGVTALINNAGVNLDGEYSFETSRRTIEVNYRGTLEVRMMKNSTAHERLVLMEMIDRCARPSYHICQILEGS